MGSPTVRAAFAALLFSSWMLLLLDGMFGHGAVHLLLAGALAAFPWRSLRPRPAPSLS
jgi:hypothetical protein